MYVCFNISYAFQETAYNDEYYLIWTVFCIIITTRDLMLSLHWLLWYILVLSTNICFVLIVLFYFGRSGCADRFVHGYHWQINLCVRCNYLILVAWKFVDKSIYTQVDFWGHLMLVIIRCLFLAICSYLEFRLNPH